MHRQNRLLRLYHILLKKYGRQRWWPVRHGFSDQRFEIIVGAILTQNTAWTNVEKALSNLRQARITTPARLLRTPPRKLAAYIRPSGYYNQKTKKLRAFCAMLVREYDGNLNTLFAFPVETLRPRLLNLFGIGPETADSIILYAAQKPVFVVDAYTKRFIKTYALTPASSYDTTQHFFMSHLPKRVALFQEFHALIVRWGKDRAKT